MSMLQNLSALHRSESVHGVITELLRSVAAQMYQLLLCTVCGKILIKTVLGILNAEQPDLQRTL